MKTEPPYRAPLSPARVQISRVLSAAFVAATLLTAAACSPKADGAAPAAAATPHNVTLTAAQLQHVRLYAVAPATFRKTIETTGVVDFDNDQATSVLAPFSGPVSRLLVSAGDKVRKGQPLAAVDSPDFAAAVSAYGKAVTVARTDRKLADTDKDLLQHNGVSQREAQQAETDAVSAEADRDAALQALVALNVDPQTIRAIQQGRAVPRIEGLIRSPIAGTVAEKLITPGQLLQAGTTPSFTVADLSRVWVLAQVSASDLPSISLGDPAQVETDVGSASLPGVVGNISALVNPDTRAVVARVVVDNPHGVLKKQMYVRVRLQSRQPSSGLLVPTSAILRDDENLPFVYVAQPAGGFARRRVTLGYSAGDQVDVTAGLQGGDRIVVDGGLFVQFMQNQ
ncbi:MAG: efflux RND transporter periplasmic adaptor subunit [Caulobacterales bacterium]